MYLCCGVFLICFSLLYPLFPAHLLVNNTSGPACMIRKKRLIFIICTTVCADCANNHEPEVFSPLGNLIFNYLDAGYVSFGWIPGISFSLPLT